MNAVDQQVLSAAEAQEITERIARGLTDVHGLIVRAWEGQAWRVLGYSTWDAWIDAHFRGLQLRPPREQRAEVVQSMRDAGMSLRAISRATTLGHATVHEVLAGDRNRSPEQQPSNVIGLDGKPYAARKKPVPTADDVAAFDDVPLDGLGIHVVSAADLRLSESITGEVVPAVEDEAPWWEEPRMALLEAESRCRSLLEARRRAPRLVEDPADQGPGVLTMAAARTVLTTTGVIVDLGVEDLDRESQTALRKVLAAVVGSLDGVLGDLEGDNHA